MASFVIPAGTQGKRKQHPSPAAALSPASSALFVHPRKRRPGSDVDGSAAPSDIDAVPLPGHGAGGQDAPSGSRSLRRKPRRSSVETGGVSRSGSVGIAMDAGGALAGSAADIPLFATGIEMSFASVGAMAGAAAYASLSSAAAAAEPGVGADGGWGVPPAAVAMAPSLLAGLVAQPPYAAVDAVLPAAAPMGFVVSAGGGGRSAAAGAGGGSCESRSSSGGGGGVGGGVVHLTGIKHLGGLGALQWSDEEDTALREAIQRVRWPADTQTACMLLLRCRRTHRQSACCCCAAAALRALPQLQAVVVGAAAAAAAAAAAQTELGAASSTGVLSFRHVPARPSHRLPPLAPSVPLSRLPLRLHACSCVAPCATRPA